MSIYKFLYIHIDGFRENVRFSDYYIGLVHVLPGPAMIYTTTMTTRDNLEEISPIYTFANTYTVRQYR